MTRAAVLSVLACGVRAMAQDAALPSTGAPLDTSGFRYVRTISGGPEGLATVVLDAAVLSHSADLGDLRIGTSTGLQVPYLVEAEARPLTLPLAPPALLPPDGSGISRYRLELPHDTLPKGRLVLRTPSRVFRREVAVRVLPPGPDRDRAPVEVARAAWAAESPDVPAEALVLELPALAASRIEVALDDGENQRLPLDPPALELPSARLRFVRPAGTSLSLYYGHPGLAAPRYDLAMLRERLAHADAMESSLGTEESMPPPPDTRANQKKVFWLVLAIATIALSVLIARLVRLAERGPAS